MSFDLMSFLSAMLQAYIECQDDGDNTAPAEMIKNQPVVRFAARRALWRQAKHQGASRRERRKFVKTHMEKALEGLDVAVARQFPTS